MAKKSDKQPRNPKNSKPKAKHGRKKDAAEAASPTYKVFTFSVIEERRTQVLIKAKSKREADDFLADHQNEIDWETLRWRPKGLEFTRDKASPFDPETYGGTIHLDASGTSVTNGTSGTSGTNG